MLAKLNKYRPHLFFILSLFFGCLNDFLAFMYAKFIQQYKIAELVKSSGFKIPFLDYESSFPFVMLVLLIFGRFFFSVVTIAPFLKYKNLFSSSVDFIKNNSYRSGFGILSIIFTYLALACSNMVIVNCIFWTIPIFGMLMNKLFLKEDIPKNQLILCIEINWIQ